MYHRRRRGRLGLFNQALLWLTFLAATLNAVLLVAPTSFRSEDRGPLAINQTASLTETRVKQDNQLQIALEQIEEQQTRIQILRSRFNTGTLPDREILVTSSKHAYWLLEPEMALGVSNLIGGGLKVQIGEQSQYFNIGTRFGFIVADQTCDLTLLKSIPGQALFYFSCNSSTHAKLAGLSQ